MKQFEEIKQSVLESFKEVLDENTVLASRLSTAIANIETISTQEDLILLLNNMNLDADLKHIALF